MGSFASQTARSTYHHPAPCYSYSIVSPWYICMLEVPYFSFATLNIYSTLTTTNHAHRLVTLCRIKIMPKKWYLTFARLVWCTYVNFQMGITENYIFENSPFSSAPVTYVVPETIPDVF